MKKHAFPLQLAKEAILLGKYPEALSLIKPLSNNLKNLDARFLTAYLHFWDDDLDRLQAIDLMTKVAESGHAEANYIIAVCPDLYPGYEFKFPPDDKHFNQLKRAANLGSEAAQTDLAQCYLEGIAVKQDEVKARELLLQAYESVKRDKYYPKTCYLLGKMSLYDIDGKFDFEAMRILARCQDAYDDPFAIEAMRLGIEVARKEKGDCTRVITMFEEGLEKITSQPILLWQSFLRYYCLKTLIYDLRDADFDAYSDFVFDHFPRLWRDRDSFRWDRHTEVIFNSSQLSRFYTQLFQNPAFLIDRYSYDQIEQGLGMQGIRGWANWTIGCAMRNQNTSVDEEEACIRSMYGLFVHLFAKAGFTEIGFMWWDIGYGACSDRHTDPKPVMRILTEEDRQKLIAANFETMVRVLNLKSRACQKAAIHGLGHSSHPDKEKVLRQYLDDNPDLLDWLRSYVMAAIGGRV